MTKSRLCSYTHICRNHSAGRGGCKVTKITPHYMAARWSGKQCADYFARAERQASSNYCIGVDGDIAMSVDEGDRAWTSSSAWNDNRAITIECGNVDNATGKMTAATWNSLVALCVDICQRYGFRLNYTGGSDGSLTEHRMFASTACPGAWLHARMGKLAAEVNARLDGTVTGVTKASPVTGGDSGDKGSGVFLVKVTCDALNVRKGPGTGYAKTGCIRDRGTYTIVETRDGWGRLKSGAGWICLDYTSRAGKAKSVGSAKSDGAAAKAVDIDALARAVIAGKYGNGAERKRRLGANYAAVQRRVNEMLK